MSSSSTFIVSHTKEVEEEELLAMDQGRSHTSSPRSRPNSRLEILIMEMTRSTEQKFESLASAQSEQTRSQFESLARAHSEQTRSHFESLARAQSEQSQSTKEQLADLARGHASDLAYIMGRLSSVEKSLHATPSPIPGRRGSSPSAETMHVSVPSTSGYLGRLSQSQVRRSQRLLLKPRPDYRLLNRSAIWQDRSITEVDEDAEYDDPTPIRRETQLKTIAGEMTFLRGPGDIVNRNIDREGQDVAIETRRVGPEVNLNF